MMMDRMAGRLQALVMTHGWWLVVAYLVLAPFKTLYEGPMAFMAIGGLLLMLTRPRGMLEVAGVRLLLALGLLIWVPMVLSLPDAVEQGRAISTTMTFLRYLFAGVFIALAMSEARSRGRLLMVAGGILAFWAVDATIQVLVGKNLLGNPMTLGRVTGVYFPRITLGHAIATFSPILLFWLGRMSATRGAWWMLLSVPLAVTVFMSGSRVAWGMFAISLLLMAGYWLWIAGRSNVRRLVPMALVAFLAVGGFLSTQPSFLLRVNLAAGLVSGDEEKINQATSLRWDIWKVAGRVFSDHTINGIGPRGFRYIYAQYAEPGDSFVNPKTGLGITHPHQLMVEVAVETGVIGLAGYFAFLFVFLRAVWRAGKERLREAWPWAAAAFISFFPLNAGHAFYGGKWGCIVWWLTALAAVFLSQPKEARS